MYVMLMGPQGLTKCRTPSSHPLRTLRKTGSIAHIIFLDTLSLEKALVPPTKPRPWLSSSEEPRGLTHYAALYDAQRPPLDVVKVHVDTWMERFEFDLAKTKQKLAYRKGEAIVDDDGVTLVTRGGTYGQTLGGGVGVASKAFEKTSRTGSKKKSRSLPSKRQRNKEEHCWISERTLRRTRHA
ncbi:hypothetical protein EV363DRAFT_1434396 [Boletus edulis]|nr:hypothetical protein EV363DRAFT_1434396 [Boletus edulis]